MPNDIQDINVNSVNKLNGDEFEISKSGIETIKDVGMFITIELKGEQTSYVSNISKGIQIIINADISFSGGKKTNQIAWPNDADLLEIDRSFKYRKEPFGYVVRCGYIETMMSESLFRLCYILKEKQVFSISDLPSIIEDFETAKTIIYTLIQRKIIVRKE